MLKGVGVAALGLGGVGTLATRASGQELPNEITITAGGSTVEYGFAVSGSVERGPRGDETDAIEGGSRVVGVLRSGSADDFRFSGNVTEFSADGPVSVTVNGEQVDDPVGLPGGSDGTTGTTAGSGSESGAAAQQAVGVIEQGDSCTPLVPLSNGGQSVSDFYGYTTDENADVEPYEPNTPGNIGRPDTSYVFLYRGSDGLSLVLIHGGGFKKQGGAATFEITGLPGGGEWTVQDDNYDDDPDVWNVGSGTSTIHWSWNEFHADGGAFTGLGGDFEITIDPAFNGAAELDPQTPGEITNWRAVTIDAEGRRQAVDLALDQPVTIRSGSCN